MKVEFDPNDISHRTIETLFVEQIRALTMRTFKTEIRHSKKLSGMVSGILKELSIKYL